MSERVLARLFLRLLGAFLVCQYGPLLLSQTSALIAVFSGGFGGMIVNRWEAAPYLVWAVTALLGVALGVNLLFWGNWAISLCTRGLSGCCFDCGYDLAGHTKDACPECGAAIPPSQRAALHAAAGKPAVDGGGLESPPP